MPREELDPTKQGYTDEEVVVPLGGLVDHTPDERKVWSGTSVPNLGDPHVPFGDATAEQILRDPDTDVGRMVGGQVAAPPFQRTREALPEVQAEQKQVDAEQQEAERLAQERTEAAVVTDDSAAQPSDDADAERAAKRSAASKKAAQTRKAKAANG
jgi:hypothetical protein